MVISTEVNTALQVPFKPSLKAPLFLKPQALIFHLFEILPFLSLYSHGPYAASSSDRGEPLALTLAWWQWSLGGPKFGALLSA